MCLYNHLYPAANQLRKYNGLIFETSNGQVARVSSVREPSVGLWV